jgi:cell division protein FtsW
LVLIPGIGIKLLGARRWINVFGITSIQPSEVLKLGMLFYIARVAETKKNLSSLVFPIIISSVIVMAQPDLGTTLIIVASGLIQIFMTGVDIRKFLRLLFMVLIGGFLLIAFSGYRRERLLSFLSLDSEKSYHIKQALLAIGSGKLLGMGFGQSRQKFLFVPESASDSIFAIIAEELGFIRTLFFLLLIFYFIFYLIKNIILVKESFGFILGIGIIAWISTQFIMNIFSMLSLIPITGVPLPFISYGGSSLIILSIGIGILINILSQKNGTEIKKIIKTRKSLYRS